MSAGGGGGISFRFGGGAKLPGGANCPKTIQKSRHFLPHHSNGDHTVHESWTLLITERVPTRRPCHAMRIKTVFPLPDLSNLLIAMFIFLVVIRPRRIVNVIPVLHKLPHIAVLLPFLATTALSLLARIIRIVIVGPICQRTLHGGSGCSRYRRISTSGCRRSRLWQRRLGFLLLSG